MGAADFMEKPVDLDVLTQRFDELLRGTSSDLVAESDAMRSILGLAAQVASTPFPVLITGETGTGKEVVARYIHKVSGRDPFVPLNCANVPAELADSLLFGHLKGSFTGAIEDKRGLVRAASGGTLFLDEIGEMPLELQAKMLRFLDSGAFMPLGGGREQKSSARVVAATNRDLSNLAEDGDFRRDLYYRLNSFPIHIPPLRKRKSDIAPLAIYHCNHLSRVLGREVEPTEEALEALVSYDYPGNVRELFNILDRAAVVANGPLGRGDVERFLSFPQRSSRAGGSGLKSEAQAVVDAREREVIVKALEEAGGNKAEAARRLQISYKTLFNKMKKLRIPT